MEILPAIDLMGGSAVRLTKGEFDSRETYSTDPTEVLKGFIAEGARNLHVVDLDGARYGSPVNFPTIAALAATGEVDIEVGGGIRDEERIESYLALGVKRVILGTVAVTDFGFTERMAVKYGEAIAVGVDVKEGFVATHGWEKLSSERGYDFCRRLSEAGVRTVIYTDVSRDGAMRGANISAYEELKNIAGLDVIASGGVTSLNDIEALAKIGVYGAIIGKALYKNAIKLSEAIALGDGNAY